MSRYCRLRGSQALGMMWLYMCIHEGCGLFWGAWVCDLDGGWLLRGHGFLGLLPHDRLGLLGWTPLADWVLVNVVDDDVGSFVVVD